MFNVFHGVEGSLGSNPRAVPTDDSLSKGGSINNSHMQWPSVACLHLRVSTESHAGCREIARLCSQGVGGGWQGGSLGVSMGGSESAKKERERKEKKTARVRKTHEK